MSPHQSQTVDEPRSERWLMKLDGMTCLVTGDNRGIGLAVARQLVKEPVLAPRHDRLAPFECPAF